MYVYFVIPLSFYGLQVVVTANRELRSQADGGSTRHIELDITNTGSGISRFLTCLLILLRLVVSHG